MIKKLNIALLIAFVAILAVKMISGLLPGEGKARSAAPTEVAEVVSNEPMVHIYYVRWLNYAVENRITNRNGVLLDTMREIFPHAEVRYLPGDVAGFVKVLAEDPAAVVVGFGAHPALEQAVLAPTPMATATLIVRTLRGNPWRYTGPESLDKLRLVVYDSLLDYEAMRVRLKRFGEGSDLFQIVKEGTSLGDIAEIIESGKADAFVDTCESSAASQEMTSAHILQMFRTSKPIAKDPVLLHVSSLDPEFAKAVVEAYESGLRRIDANGVRKRIFDYYGMTPNPL